MPKLRIYRQKPQKRPERVVTYDGPNIPSHFPEEMAWRQWYGAGDWEVAEGRKRRTFAKKQLMIELFMWESKE